MLVTEAEHSLRPIGQAIVDQIAEIHEKHAHATASGYFKHPFGLRITRQGCQFEGNIQPPSKYSTYDNKPEYSREEKAAFETRLKSWYDHAAISGYGDVRAQVTKLNTDVRNAREIPASEFSVEPELLHEIAQVWDRNFYPNTGIRVEPYKIHLYGPGGHFDLHRDTPQKDLVGTFLLGLGDTTYGGGLYVGGMERPAHGGYWCAFYPDVPHRVARVSGGYRAVIAFKLFRTSDTFEETATSSQVGSEVASLVRQMKAPFGIMLERKYCLGTTTFSGFDALMLDTCRSLPKVDVKHLPVILVSHSEWGTHDEYEEGYEMECSTSIYPFTRGHIDALVDGSSFKAGLGHYYDYRGPTDHTSCGCPWLEGVKNVPFFAFDLSRSLVSYSEEERETCNYTGNEAQAWRDDSVYLSYALLVLPKDREVPSTEA